MTVGELRTFLVTNADLIDDKKVLHLWDPESGLAIQVQRVEFRNIDSNGDVHEPHVIGDDTNSLLFI